MKRNQKDDDRMQRRLGRRTLLVGGLQLAFAGALGAP